MGNDILEKPSKARSYLGYMAQKFSLYGDLTVMQNLRFFAGVYGLGILKRKGRIEEMVDVFHFKKIFESRCKRIAFGV